MKAFASSFGAWRSIEQNEGVKVPHGLVFSLAVVAAIGAPHGLEMVAEEEAKRPEGFDAIFISVLDSRCMIPACRHFRSWRVPFRRADRAPVGRYPLVWMGGQGLHNPMPMYDVADLIVVGDAEDLLPELLRLWEHHGNTDGFLSAASTVPGVLVPAHHDPSEARVVQSVASDISVTLRNYIDISHNGTRRIEIARGCRYKCAFCSLGWRAPVRENHALDVVREIHRSKKTIHLQAGDAESHSGIDAIRVALRKHGGHDQGWTGRFDTLLENPDQTIPGQKRYAFGVEGVSHRLRRAVGKGYLTDERIVSDTVRFFASLPGENGRSLEAQSKGRAAWHLIAGLPGERATEVMELGAVIRRIDDERHGRVARNLTIHWQPFQPLPGTPMQWCAGGTGARRMASLLRPFERLAWCCVRQHGGRTDQMALVCASLARSDRRGAALLEALEKQRVTPDEAVAISGSSHGALDPDTPLPWDWIEHAYPRRALRRAYDVMMRRLGTPPAR